MERLKLLAAMAALAALMAAAVVLGSPFEPVIAPVAEIEAIWAIEDTRTESEAPLVRVLHNHGVPLGFDEESSTFYCTLGLGHGEAWPDIHLTAESGKGVQLVFVDDYGYDWCDEAIAEGYPYQVMAYTDEAFWYFDIVFTGLPIVSLYCEDEITAADTPAQISLSVFGSEPVSSAAMTHLRGAGTRYEPKKNLRVNFTRDGSGRKNMVDLPGFGARADINLNPMVFDETMLRERVSWRLYGDLLGEGYDGALGARKTSYAEVFLNDEYQGVYLMLEPINGDEELRKEGGSRLLTDSIYRSIVGNYMHERPVTDNPLGSVSKFQLRYEPPQATQFAMLQDYLNLLAEKDDEAFRRRAACMDMESVVLYALLRQVAGLADNVGNNLYLWAKSTPDGIRYVMAPWDLDFSWGRNEKTMGAENQNWMSFSVVDRMLTCDVPGFRELMVGRWREWRQSVFTQEHIERRLEEYESELTASGAMRRNAEKWDVPETAGVEELMNFASARLEVLDAAMEMIAETACPPFIPPFGSGEEHLPIL